MARTQHGALAEAVPCRGDDRAAAGACRAERLDQQSELRRDLWLHFEERPELHGDPWEGCEDLAREDLVEWLLDFSRRKDGGPHSGPEQTHASLQQRAGEERLRAVVGGLLCASTGAAVGSHTPGALVMLRGGGSGPASATAMGVLGSDFCDHASSVGTASTASSLHGVHRGTAPSSLMSLATSTLGAEAEEGPAPLDVGGTGYVGHLRGWGPVPAARAGERRDSASQVVALLGGSLIRFPLLRTVESAWVESEHIPASIAEAEQAAYALSSAVVKPCFQA